MGVADNLSEQTTSPAEGVVIGMLLGFESGKPLVVFPGNPNDEALPARALCHLTADDTGKEVALLFEDGNRARPLIIGRIIEPVRTDEVTPAPKVIRDGETVKIAGETRIELRVGKAAIIMESDGQITIRGKTVVSHASGSNHIRGGTIKLN
ncbi:DUF6484 domain-containing protein [Aquicoccus sp. G2-2]|uniref:DUF6484 domain-containing protein n=1 Tax=Aquicoccus sp. G2-2 TaxID=3092120 RepID=UPI002ADF1DBB|nr:DUF6484 domain-containing protein [Aquicoccus sp. G2-2]MEA1114691.1 DUF6484 domain-containing protein [Aquicoccus sp. G2-2]